MNSGTPMNKTTKLAEKLNDTPLVLDGAWGTQFQTRGLPIGESSEAWNLSNPDPVTAVAQSYVDAGSDIILTNTFCGNRIMLQRHGLEDKTVEINQRGAELSREAAKDKALVLGSIGPTGELLMMSDYSEDTLTEIFSEQAKALVAGGVDGIVLETMAALDEVRCAAKAVKDLECPFIISMIYDSGPSKDRTMMGTSPEEAASVAEELGAIAVGANCGVGIEEAFGLVEALKKSTSLPLWIKPNAGLPRMENGACIYDAKPDDFARKVSELIQLGASLVGGCCGTSPDFIRAIRETVDAG